MICTLYYVVVNFFEPAR